MCQEPQLSRPAYLLLLAKPQRFWRIPLTRRPDGRRCSCSHRSHGPAVLGSSSRPRQQDSPLSHPMERLVVQFDWKERRRCWDRNAKPGRDAEGHQHSQRRHLAPLSFFSSWLLLAHGCCLFVNHGNLIQCSTLVTTGQKRLTLSKSGYHWSTKINQNQHWSMKGNRGQPRSMVINQGQQW